MSRIQSQVQNKVQNKGQGQAQTPFCKVCFDSGKSVSEYTSHYPRQSPSPQSPVVCPTILSNECSYCHDKGHLPSCCPALKTKNKVDKIKERETLRKVYQEETKQKEVKKAKVTNVFAALESDDEEIEVKKVSEQKVSQKKVSEEKVKEEYPALPTTKKPITTTTQPAVPFSYSSMAAKPAFIKETPKTRPVAAAVAVAREVDFDFEEEEELYRKAREEVLSRKKPLLASQINWGTTVDSDSDEDW
jgi:hypothetical protein